jgi:hypothetical protein
LFCPFPVRLAAEDSVTGKERYALKSLNLPAAWCIDRSWDALCPDVASASDRDTRDKRAVDSNVLIRNSGFAYRTSVDLCMPTKFMWASPDFLMLTSAKDPR